MVRRYEVFYAARALLFVLGADVSGQRYVVVGVFSACGVVLPGVLNVVEHALFNVCVALVACSDAVVGERRRVEAVEQMHLSEAYARHALAASLVPPAAVECGAQLALALGLAVASAPEVAVAVVVRSA